MEITKNTTAPKVRKVKQLKRVMTSLGNSLNNEI